ncbi:MAG: M56 family metallopeptidase [Sphingomonas sp.]
MSGIAGTLIPWAVEALIASTLLMVLVLALRGPVRRAFGPDIAYMLWLLPVLRLLLPPLPQGWRESVTAPVARAGEQFVILVADPVIGGGAAAPASHAPVLGPALILLWVAGAAAFISWHAVAHARFCRRMLAQSAGEAANADGIRVIETGAASGPLAFGVWRRYVAFPRDFTERYDADERDLALAHELGHHARGDLIANWAALGVLALHWFNPVAWRAFRAFRADQEIANDARVLAGRDAVTRHLYACAIVKAAHGGAVSTACHLHTVEDLKGRLKMLTTNKTSRGRLAGGAGALALIATAALGATASGTQAAERVRAKVEKATGVQLSELTLPASFHTGPAAPDMPGAAPALATDAGGRHHDRTVIIDGNNTTIQDGAMRDGVARRMVIRSADGHAGDIDISTDGAAMPVNIPSVESGNCDGDRAISRNMTRSETRDGQRRIVICVNRINAAATRGAAIAMRGHAIERHAYAQALEGLRAKRSAIAGDAMMDEEGRRGALQGIDQAIHELEGDLAVAD